jgi:hypothetical protein
VVQPDIVALQPNPNRGNDKNPAPFSSADQLEGILGQPVVLPMTKRQNLGPDRCTLFLTSSQHLHRPAGFSTCANSGRQCTVK